MLVVQINCGGVVQVIDLLLHLRDNSWMAVTHSRGGSAREQIKVSSTGMIKKVLHFALNNHDWVSVDSHSTCREVFISSGENLFV